MLGLLDLLGSQGFDLGKRFKLVRHQEAKYDLYDFLRRGWLDSYQAFQSRPVFDGLDYIVSFIGDGGTRARFLGIYEVLNRLPSSSGLLPEGCPYANWRNLGNYYVLRRVPGFEELESRLVIEWGRGTLAWHQKPANKDIIEILPTGSMLKPFSDYLDFTLTSSELRYLCGNPTANRDWQARLSAVAGIYLILATTTGSQYVGSATGVYGIWGRWIEYAISGHGGDKLLRELMDTDAAYPEAFTYSILQILPRTTTRTEVLRWERRYKEKLGTRALELGLNAN